MANNYIVIHNSSMHGGWPCFLSIEMIQIKWATPVFDSESGPETHSFTKLSMGGSRHLRPFQYWKLPFTETWCFELWSWYLTLVTLVTISFLNLNLDVFLHKFFFVFLYWGVSLAIQTLAFRRFLAKRLTMMPRLVKHCCLMFAVKFFESSKREDFLGFSLQRVECVSVCARTSVLEILSGCPHWTSARLQPDAWFETSSARWLKHLVDLFPSAGPRLLVDSAVCLRLFSSVFIGFP